MIPHLIKRPSMKGETGQQEKVQRCNLLNQQQMGDAEELIRRDYNNEIKQICCRE